MVMLRQKLTLEVGVIRKHVASRACTLGLQRQNWLVKREIYIYIYMLLHPDPKGVSWSNLTNVPKIFFKGAGEKPPTRKTIGWSSYKGLVVKEGGHPWSMVKIRVATATDRHWYFCKQESTEYRKWWGGVLLKALKYEMLAKFIDV